MKKMIITMMMAVVSLSSFAQFGGGQMSFKPEDMATRRAEQVKEAAKTTDEQSVGEVQQQAVGSLVFAVFEVVAVD